MGYALAVLLGAVAGFVVAIVFYKHEIALGKSVVAAVEADWQKTKALFESLPSKGKDALHALVDKL